jgi:nucleoside-diphosphate-sugar epimerase
VATEIEGSRVAVTGAGGFIGSATCRRLSAEGANVVGIDVNGAAAEKVRAAGAEFALADVTDPGALSEALTGVELAVHTAAYVHEYGTMDEFVRVNVGGTVNVLDAAEEVGIERLVHISSVVVYGYDDAREQDEDAYRRAVGIPYIDTKSSSDRIACRRGAIVIRLGDVYGPGSTPWTVRPVEMIRRGLMSVPGRGEGILLPVYVDDVVAAIVLGLRHGEQGRAYTVWSGETVPFKRLVGRYADMVGAKRPRRVPRPLMVAAGAIFEAFGRVQARPPLAGRHGPVFFDRRGTVSNERARDELGWEPKVDFDEGMGRTEEWLRAEGLV